MIEPTFAGAHDAPIAGKDYPADLAQLRAWFPNDAACMDYLSWLRWPDGVTCLHCHGGDVKPIKNGRLRCSACWYRFSVTVGTLFEKTRTPLTVWFEAIWLVTAGKTGVSAAHLHRVLPISSYQTAWAMLGRLRQVMTTSESALLSGRVEVDESLFGGHRAGKPGRGALGKTLVAGAIEITEHGWGRARLATIPDASTDSLQQFVEANIAPGSTVISDGWAAYPGALQGYVHEPLNISASGMPAHESLPAVHRLFALAKRMIEGTYQGAGTVAHLQEYLDEFVFRFNRRHSRNRGLVFMRLLQRAAVADPVTYRALVREPKPKETRPLGKAGRRSQPGTLTVSTAGRPWRDEY